RRPAGPSHPFRQAYGGQSAQRQQSEPTARRNPQPRALEGGGRAGLLHAHCADRRRQDPGLARLRPRSCPDARAQPNHLRYPLHMIIDQTAAIFRDILGDENVLEHHSAIDDEKHPCREGRDKLKLAMEDWAAPVIVTTNVQLFESLFASRASRCRKLHNIAGSLIILDEAQTIPRPLLAPCVRMLAELVRGYGCTIVLCTATQPALDARHFAAPSPLALPLARRELAPDPERLARELKRVTLHHAGDKTNAELTAALAAEPQGLVIVNSRRHALELYLEGKSAGLAGLVHLTTRQHASDRREILTE